MKRDIPLNDEQAPPSKIIKLTQADPLPPFTKLLKPDINNIITNQDADVIYKKLLLQFDMHAANKATKKPWTDDEFKLLFWSFEKYCNERIMNKTKRLGKNIPTSTWKECHSMPL